MKTNRIILFKKAGTFRLAKEEGEHHLGEAVEGLAIKIKSKKMCSLRIFRKSRKGHYAFGTVTGSRRDLGVSSISV